MSDPIEKLTRLGEALEGAPMPLPASEVRARGDRIRRRKHAVIAGASAAVVVAVAVPVVAFTLNGSDDEPPVTPRPTVTDTNPVPSAALSDENLLTDGQAIYPNGGSDWRVRDTYPGDGQSAFSPCAQQSMAGLGAEQVFKRDFDFVVLPSEEIEPTLHLNEIIAEFPTAADAEAAAGSIRGWLRDCLPPGAEEYGAGPFTTVPLPVDGTAEVQLSTYGPVDESIDPFGDFAYFLETGVVVSGDRVAVLTQIVPGQDYNWPEGTPVEQMIPDAAQQLAIGNGTPTEVEPSDGTDWPTVLSPDFPLTSGWPRDDGSAEFQLTPPSIDNQAMVAAGELTACDQAATDPGAIDRLTTRLSLGSSAYVREVLLFADHTAAARFLDSVQDVYSACPTEDQNGTPPTFTTEVGQGAIGEESWVITRASDGIGRLAIHVVRVGNAVLVDLASDEGTGDTVRDLATVTRENLADVVTALDDLQGGGSSGSSGPDLSAPAGVTTIPDGFPLALALSEPPVEDGETTIEGPDADVAGVRAQTACRAALAMPNAGVPDAEHELGYSVSSVEGYEGRTIHAYPTVQDALDLMEELRTQLMGCDRDSEGDGLSDRLWRTFNSDTGYDSVTFGYTYEVVDNVGAPAGQLYTVVRVGNAVLAVEWSGEYSADYQAVAAPDQVELTRMIADEMCVFAAAGC